MRAHASRCYRSFALVVAFDLSSPPNSETVMKLFRLDASPRTEGSHSRQIADIVQSELSSTDDALTVTNREIAINPWRRMSGGMRSPPR
jgi:hypothetical protein